MRSRFRTGGILPVFLLLCAVSSLTLRSAAQTTLEICGAHRVGLNIAECLLSTSAERENRLIPGPAAIEAASATTVRLQLPPNLVYDFAEMLFREKDYEDAALQYRLILRTSPEFDLAPRCRVKMALCYVSAGRYEEAQIEINSILEDGSMRDRWEEALLWQAVCFYRSDDILSSLELLGMLMQDARATDIGAYASYHLAWVYLVRGDIAPASRLFAQLSKPQEAPWGLSDIDLSSLSKAVLEMESLPSKSPVIAGILSGCVPGTGHFYCQRYTDGLVALGLNGTFVAAAVESFDKRIYVAGGIASSVELVWYSGTIYGAVNAAHRFNRLKREEFIDRLRREFGDERTHLIERLCN